MTGWGGIITAVLGIAGLWKIITAGSLLGLVGREAFIILGIFLFILYMALK